MTEHSRAPIEPNSTAPNLTAAEAEPTAAEAMPTAAEPEPSAENAASSAAEAEPNSADAMPTAAEAEPAAETAALDPGERAELERLRAESAGLHDQKGTKGRRRHFSWRALVSIVLIVLGCVIAPVAVLGVWAGTEVSDTGRWVATVEPLIHNQAIQNVLTDKITNEITSQLNLTSTINQASAQLNSRGLTRISSLLTSFGPQITSAVNGFIHSTVQTVITSPAVANIWVQVNTAAHSAVVKVLSGQGGGAISTSNGQIVLNLGPFIAVVKQDLIQHGFSLASNIPAISPTIALFQANDLGKAQSAYRLITTLKIVLPILVLLLLAGGVYAARRRRRALIGAGLGLAASMLVLAIGLLIARSIYLNSVPANVLPSDAAAAAFDAMVYFIKVSLRVVLAVGLIVAIGAFVTGPSHTAIQIRSGLKSGMSWVRNFGERRGVSTGPVGEWTYLHRRALRISAVALIALIFVFWGHPTVLVVIVLVIILLVLLGLIELIGRPIAEPETASPA